MQWLNYHHLLYFWHVVREGGLAGASKALRLAPSTLSAQIGSLEKVLGEQLFTKRGRRLALTDVGTLVYRYADDIFSLGKELQQAVQSGAPARPRILSVGVAAALPKLIVQKLLEPALHMAEPVHIVCREDSSDRLVSELAVYDLDVVLSDVPVGPSLRVRAYSHLLGECGTTFFGAPALARKYGKTFPACLAEAPVLLPTANTTLRRSLDHWFAARRLSPKVVGEFEDSALLKAFGHAGAGLFPGPSVIAREIARQYQVRVIGEVPEIKEQYYAISVERRLRHPAVLAISEQARHQLFA